jgi:NAD(P) transhydrogenase subunit alpha
VQAFAMEQVPRLSRAQSMDALTSQALVTGYRGVVVALGLSRRSFPALSTMAGTVPPAEVLVLGSGVVGLEAIATARRLGARVRGYDVRPTSAEEIASLGAEPLDLGLPPLTGDAAYTREMSAEQAERLRAALAPQLATTDVLITTAAVPGRRPPVLVTAAMLAQVRPGTVVVDLVADLGGNVEGAVPGELVRVGEARVWGADNVPAQLPGPASALYAGNVVSLLESLVVTGPDGPRVTRELSDEVHRAAAVTGAQGVVHSALRRALAGLVP